MYTVNLNSLISKLNVFCKSTLESAAGLCLARTHYNIEIEHWLLKMLENSKSDLVLLLDYFKVDLAQLNKDILHNLETLKIGNVRTPAISQNIVDLCREAWVMSSLEHGSTQLRSGAILLALLSDDSLSRLAKNISKEFAKISVEQMQKQLFKLTKESSENQGENFETSNPVCSSSSQNALNQFTIDITEQAKLSRIDPVVERDNEIRQLIDILMRRRQNNPILTGEAGVGKTAVVEGFALRIAKGDVPPNLRNVSIKQLDLGLLQAGAGVKGEFENRLKSVISEVKSSARPIILFIDEAHTLIGAGGQQGQNDAANLLKPALARGELRTIAATTWSEYKKYFEQDPALTRRFQVVKVEEPSEESAVIMLQNILETLEKHHKVKILDEAIIEAVSLSNRYLSGRQLPDKAVSLLDTACARVAKALYDTPALIEDCNRQLSYLTIAKANFLKEEKFGVEHKEQLLEINNKLNDTNAKLEKTTKQWEEEKTIINEILSLHVQLDTQPSIDADKLELTKHKIAEFNLKLKEVQGETPFMQPWVDKQAIAEVIGSWTGIPVGRMVSNQIQNVLHLNDVLEKRVIGQSHALNSVAEVIKTSHAKLTDPRKPIGVFLFVGTSGVGKTETALALAETLYGGEQNITVLNMSEFREEHKISTLVGAPPGYVGYGQGGILTEAVRRKPYSLILLDEIEKAHPNIQDFFYQVFDKGVLRDSEGRDVNFKNTVIIMTSNACTNLITQLCLDQQKSPDINTLKEAIMSELLKIFKPAFLGRVQVIPFYPLDDKSMISIIELQLARLAKRIEANHKITFSYDNEVVDFIADQCAQLETGARTIENLLSSSLLPDLSTRLLVNLAEEKVAKKIHVGLKDNVFNYNFFYDDNAANNNSVLSNKEVIA